MENAEHIEDSARQDPNPDPNLEEIAVDVEEYVVEMVEYIGNNEDPNLNPNLETTSANIVENAEHIEDGAYEDPGCNSVF